MAGKVKIEKVEPKGTKSEMDSFHEVMWHHRMAQADLDQRRADWRKKDELFRSHIDSSNWPYNSLVFDPRVFTALLEKSARLLANKPKGRMVPRDGGDSLGAMVNNSLLDYQWDENERASNTPMLAKWHIMDQNTRKYGAAFGRVSWKYQKKLSKKLPDELKKGNKKDKEMFRSIPLFDGPDFEPLNNRDCLHNPSYSNVKNWFQHREWKTLQELRSINDAQRTTPRYKNLDLLADRLKAGQKGFGGDTRTSRFEIPNKTIKSLDDWLGRDPFFKVVEIVTEYRDERWITFAPRHGIVLRDIRNPYDHGEIPIVQMKYYPIDDDIYGLSEIEPVEKLQLATNALINQYLDAINMSLYAPLKIKASGVQMHTLEFGPGAKWIMDDPANVVAHDQSTTGVKEFSTTYSFMISAIQNAFGETSQGVSGISPFEPEKTATEIRDTASQRQARDNFNQLFLAEALKKQMGMWHTMNRQFLFSDTRDQAKVIRIVGKEAMNFFQKKGLDQVGLSQESIDLLSQPEIADSNITMESLQEPLFPVGMEEGGDIPKFAVEEGGDVGLLVIEEEDLSGNYDYIPDTESMVIPNKAQLIRQKKELLETSLAPEVTQSLLQDGVRIKTKELIEDLFEQMGTKDASKYFEKIDVNQTGEAGLQGGTTGVGNGGQQGVAGGSTPVAGGKAKPVVPGPTG